MIRSLIILSLSIAVSSPALASRKKTVGDILNQIDAKGASKSNTRRSRAVIPKTRSIEAVRPKNISKVKPVRTRAIMQSDRETAQLESVIDESIDELFKLTQKYKRSPNRGELWLRLGELYVEKAKLIELRTYEEYDEQLNRFYDKKRKSKPKLNLKLSHDFNKKAIRLYDWFVRDFPKDRKVDQALFFLGYNYFQIGNTKQGAKYYEILNKRFPRSKFVSESNFSLGEYYFDSNRWKPAVTAYNRVIKEGDPRLTSFALYKKAWASHRLGKTKSALKMLEQVIQIGRRTQQRKIKLVAEAQRDMVVFFANVGSYKQGESYLSRFIEREKLDEALEKLAFLYVELGNRPAARYTFTNLINKKPTAEKALDYQFQITDTYAGGGNRKVYLRELEKFVRVYNKDSDWARANPNSVSKSESLREKYLRNHSLQNHQLYIKSKSKLAKSMAESGYKLYLQYFKNQPSSAEVHFFYGELLYDQKKYREAAKSYDWVVKNASQSEYYDKALNNALIALEKSLPSEKSIRAKVGDSVEKFEIPSAVLLFLSISESYVSKFQQPLRRAEIKFRAGRIYYLYNHFDKAEAIFQDIIKNHPRTKYANFSTNLILDIYNLKKDYKGLTVVGNQLLQNPELASSAALKDVKNVLEKASFKKAQDLEESKDYVASANEFSSFAAKYPGSSLATAAMYNAGVNFERAGKSILALAMYAKVGNQDKNSKQKNSAVLLQANLLQKVGRYEEAARAFEKYSKLNPKDKKIADIHFNAAVLWDAINNDGRAVQQYEAYYRKSKASDRALALHKVALIYRDNKKYQSAVKYFKRFIAEYKGDRILQAQAHDQLADVYDILRDNPKSLYWRRQIISKFSRTGGKASRYYAEAKFRIAVENYKSYEKLKFPSDPNQQATVLNRKLKLLNNVNNEFSDIIKINSGPQIIASLTYLGKAYEHFADSVDNAPKPTGLTADEMKQYQEGLKQVTQPKLETAIQFYKEALSKSKDLDIYDESTKIAYKAMTRFDPTNYLWGEDYVIENPSIEVKDL